MTIQDDCELRVTRRGMWTEVWLKDRKTFVTARVIQLGGVIAATLAAYGKLNQKLRERP